MSVTHGCLRLYPDDIKTLFDLVPIGMPVYIVNQPYKAGWFQQTLYFEAHPVLLEEKASDHLTDAVRVLVKATRNQPYYPIDWKQVNIAARTANGVPAAVNHQPR